MKIKTLIMTFGILAINACGNVKGDDHLLLRKIKKIDISNASSLAVVKKNSSTKELVKFKNSSEEVEKVAFLDKDGNKIKLNLSYTELYDVNESYLVNCIGEYHYPQICHLVNKENGNVYILAELENSLGYFPSNPDSYNYLLNAKIFKADSNNFIYYVSKDRALVQIDTSDIEDIKSQIISSKNEAITDFAVSNSGNIAYFGRNEALVNKDISVIITNTIIPGSGFTLVFTNEEGELFVCKNNNGTDIFTVNEDGLLLFYANINDTYIDLYNNYLLNIDKQGTKTTILVDTNNKKIIELYEENNNLIIKQINNDINAVDIKDGMLFMAIKDNPKLIVFDFEGDAYEEQFLSNTLFENYNITKLFVISENEIIFSAQDLTMPGKEVNAKFINDEILIIDEITNPIVNLIKIN